MRPGGWRRVASLRYFDAAGNFAADLAGVLGGPLPAAQHAVCYGTAGSSPEVVLAWRSPTETLLVCGAALLDAIETFAAPRSDVSVVDQTGGIRAWTLTGVRVSDVLLRLGAPSVIPPPGGARIGRLAELTVLLCCVRPGEILLLVDRVYEQHLMAWVRETGADL